MGLLILFIACGIMAIIGAQMLEKHGRAGTGAVLGFLLGPIGILIAFLMAEGHAREKREREERERDRAAWAAVLAKREPPER